MKEAKVEKAFLKGLRLCGTTRDADTVTVDVGDGKILRIRPLRFDCKNKPQEFRLGKIEARGKVFRPSTRSWHLPCLRLARNALILFSQPLSVFIKEA